MSVLTLEKIYKSGIKLTPMMSQYYEIKKQHEDDIVFFRMGDFYEVFFEDARDVSKILNIALTHRGKLGETPVPMAGIPHHAANNYIDRITEAGRRVAVCEQVQNPKDAIGIVKRAVTQIVSPGLPYDLSKINEEETFYISAANKKGSLIYITFLDYSTGDFFGHLAQNEVEMIDLLQKYKIKEFVSYPGQWNDNNNLEDFLKFEQILKSTLAKDYFEYRNCHEIIEKFIPNYRHDQVIMDNQSILGPISAIASFVDLTQKPEKILHLAPFKFVDKKNKLYISSKTLQGLEIVSPKGKSQQFNLYEFMKKTKTPMGARVLQSAFSNAMTEVKQIRKKQGLLQYFVSNFELLQKIEMELDPIRDIDRLLTKITTKKYIPQDLINLAQSLEQFDKVLILLKDLSEEQKEVLFYQLPEKKYLQKVNRLIQSIVQSINSELGASLEKGNLILTGICPTRDHLFELFTNSSQKFDDLEKKYLSETNIPKIKIKNNNIHGYFIEVSKTHSAKVPNFFIRRQTLVQSERYVTDELTNLENEVLQAGEKLKEVENNILQDLIKTIIELNDVIKKISLSIGQIDLAQSMAKVAVIEQWTCPEISETTLCLEGAWHPLIKKSTKGQFVPHDIKLDKNNFFGLITGPNMAGKTTVMREMAIIQLLAQMGSFVPAKKATITICDKIFSRLGASDNIQEGQSTFMVEMSETAEIIRHATSNSLIILDEIGRGTSTYDGLSIAWSLVEYLVKKLQAKTLFATHYHELIELVDSLEGAKNLTVEAKSEGENVKFLYRLIEEGANQSYGIYVAKLAGIPKNILTRAKSKLAQLEKIEAKQNNSQLDFFEVSNPLEIDPCTSEIELGDEDHLVIDELNNLDINNLTPLQAFKKIQQWKERTGINLQ